MLQLVAGASVTGYFGDNDNLKFMGLVATECSRTKKDALKGVHYA
jgi:hypothetical protein